VETREMMVLIMLERENRELRQRETKE